MRFGTIPTIFPTVASSDAGANGRIPLYAPGGSRIPNLLILSQRGTQTNVVAGQRLSYDTGRESCTDSATAGTVNGAQSHGFPHGFLSRFLGWIASAGTASEWTDAGSRLTTDQYLDGFRVLA